MFIHVIVGGAEGLRIRWYFQMLGYCATSKSEGKPSSILSLVI